MCMDLAAWPSGDRATNPARSASDILRLSTVILASNFNFFHSYCYFLCFLASNHPKRNFKWWQSCIFKTFLSTNLRSLDLTFWFPFEKSNRTTASLFHLLLLLSTTTTLTMTTLTMTMVTSSRKINFSLLDQKNQLVEQVGLFSRKKQVTSTLLLLPSTTTTTTTMTTLNDAGLSLKKDTHSALREKKKQRPDGFWLLTRRLFFDANSVSDKNVDRVDTSVEQKTEFVRTGITFARMTLSVGRRFSSNVRPSCSQVSLPIKWAAWNKTYRFQELQLSTKNSFVTKLSVGGGRF